MGLRARLPFVALEYCEGLDLFDFASSKKGLPAMMRGLKAVVRQFLDAQNVTAVTANAMAATDLVGVRNVASQDVNSLLVVDLLQVFTKNQEQILSLLSNVHAIVRPKTKKESLTKDESLSREAPKDPTDLDAFISALAARYDADHAGAKVDKLPTAPKAVRALRRLFEYLVAWDWHSAVSFLSSPHFDKFFPGGISLTISKDQEMLHRLAEIAGKEREIAGRTCAKLGQLLLQDQLCLSKIFDPRREISYTSQNMAKSTVATVAGQGTEPINDSLQACLQLENALLRHIYTPPGKERVQEDVCAAPGESSFPAEVAWAIIRQAAEAVKELHSCGISGLAHCDIKSENFVLTVEGRLKLVDFGFLLDLQQLDNLKDDPPPAFVYSSPEFRQLNAKKFSFSQLVAETKMSPSELFKANDVWMLGQTLFYLLTRTSDSVEFYAKSYCCDGIHGWDAINPDRSRAIEMIMSAGLPDNQAQALAKLLFENILVPVHERARDAGKVLAAIEELDIGGWANAGQVELLRLLWPYFAPSPQSGKAAKGRGPTVAAVFEADMKYVKVHSFSSGSTDDYGTGYMYYSRPVHTCSI